MTESSLNSICGYCSTGCSMSVRIQDGNALKVDANPDYPVNRGKACVKGFQFLAHLRDKYRATTPFLRTARGELEPVSWDRALETFVERFKEIGMRHGKEAIAFLGTGQITNEDFAFFGALAKFGMGLIHGDGNTRQCMATAAVAYKESFGFDAPPFTYADFEASDTLIFIGSNPAIAHPIMWGRVCRRKDKPAVIVIDPRKTETAGHAISRHYPIRPKSDLLLLYAISHILIEKDWIDREYIDTHTEGFREFRHHVNKFDLEEVSSATGLSVKEIDELAGAIHRGKRVSFWWMVGINQGHQGVRTAQAIINLALMTGNIGKPGTGPNSITGQCNAMGSRLFSNTTNLLGGYEFSSSAHREKISEILGIERAQIPDRLGLPYDKILEKIDEGEIKGLWIVCTNPAHSWIASRNIEKTLRKLEFLVVQNMFYDTETARIAHLILPAAGCGEKDGTFINSERRIGLVQRVSAPPGDALPDFEIFRQIAKRWGCGEQFNEWTSPEAVFQILKKISKGMPWDISGIRDYAMIDEMGGIQWPFPEGSLAQAKERRMFEDGRYFHHDERARFFFEDVADLPEKTDDEYPFILLTGRGSVSQWHTLTRTDRAPLLSRMSPGEVYIELNPEDAERLRVRSDQHVLVASRRGEVRVKARVCNTVQPGQVFMPMHFCETNVLTFPSFDPYSRQPSYKYSAVSVERTEDGS